MQPTDYTSAGALPAKVIRLADKVYSGGRLHPVHVQIAPTNVCQLDCGFCSCANRQNNVEMPYTTYYAIMAKFAQYGCKAVTITGGGEPTLHPKITEILHATKTLGIETGLVSNGLSLDKVRPSALRTLTWCRISFSDDRDFSKAFAANIEQCVSRAPQVDWAFSYVLTTAINYDTLAKVIDFANNHQFTHVRLVGDLLDITNVASMPVVQKQLEKLGVDDRLVIYQGRKEYTTGAKQCWLSLVKPVIAADGGWYPCCGVQYALDNPSLDFESAMCMGTDFESIADKQEPFDGSVCKRCYYAAYNEVLGAMIGKHNHAWFV